MGVGWGALTGVNCLVFLPLLQFIFFFFVFQDLVSKRKAAFFAGVKAEGHSTHIYIYISADLPEKHSRVGIYLYCCANLLNFFVFFVV